MAASLAVSKKSDWRTGGLVAALFLALILGWEMWPRAPLVAAGLLAAVGALCVFLYPMFGVALAGFLVTSGMNEFVGGLTSPLLLGIIVMVTLRKLMTGDLSWRWIPFTWLTIIFFTWLQFTGLWSERLDAYSWNYIYRAVLLVLVVTELVDSKRDMLILMAALLLGVCFTCAWTIKSFVTFYTTGAAETLAKETHHVDKSRFAGHWSDANYLATSMLCYLGPALALWKADVSRHFKRLSLLTAVLICITVIFTLSRAGMLIAFIVLVMMLAVQKRRMLFGMSFAVIMILLFTLVPMDVVGRLESLLSGDASTGGRSDLLKAAWQLYWRNPIFGSGLDTFILDVTNVFKHIHRPIIAHNTYAEVAVESGLVGAILYLVLLISVGRGLDWKTWSYAGGDFYTSMHQGLRASFVAVLVAMATLSAYSFAPYWMVMTLAALLPYLSDAAPRNAAAAS